jgi:hypothetical protein
MSMGVIDPLEVVQVHEEQGHATARDVRMLECRSEPAMEEAIVAEAREVVAAGGLAGPLGIQEGLHREGGVRGEDLEKVLVAAVERTLLQAVHQLEHPAHGGLEADRDRQETPGAEGQGLVEVLEEVGIVAGLGDEMRLAGAVDVADHPEVGGDAGTQKGPACRAECGDEVERVVGGVGGPLEGVVEEHRARLRGDERVGAAQHLADEATGVGRLGDAAVQPVALEEWLEVCRRQDKDLGSRVFHPTSLSVCGEAARPCRAVPAASLTVANLLVGESSSPASMAWWQPNPQGPRLFAPFTGSV